MRREFAVLCVAFLAILLIFPSSGRCGYRLNSGWRSDTKLFTYIVEVQSGSPPPFRDLHIETGDADPDNYVLAVAPDGWQMSIVPKDDDTGEAWISFYGSQACTYAVISIEYHGSLENLWANSEWRLTDDGDPDPDSGLMPGESGDRAVGPWRFTGSNAGFKVGVHVIPHEDRACGRNQPAITTCSDIQATCEVNDVDFFPVFFDLTEYQCIGYSVEWPGTYSCAFVACDFTHFGTIQWPAGTVAADLGKDWINHCYRSCMPGPIAIPGWGWIYEPGPATIRIVPCTASGELSVLDCNSREDEPICNFAAGIGGALGEQLCGPSATEPTTWGAIKALFE